MDIEAQGTVFDAADRPPNQSVASFVSLCRQSSGRLLCGFQLGSAKHATDATIRLCHSIDHGSSWQELPARFDSSYQGVPGSLSSAELVELAPGHLLLYATWFDRSDPDRPLFDPVSEGILPSRQLLAESNDGGQRWTPWREIPLPNLSGCSATGPLLRWPNGWIGLALESYKQFDDPSPARHAAWLLISRDHGRTFDPPVLVAQDPAHQIYYWDQRLCRGLADDDAIAMFWTHDRSLRRDLTVHLRRLALGPDRPGSPIVNTGIQGQIAAPLMLPDGRMLCFVVDRAGPLTMKLWVSHDAGRTWPESDSLVIYQHQERAVLSQGSADVDYAEYWADMQRWSFGHPAIQYLNDQRVIVAYYAGRPGCLNVRWARVDVAG